MLKKKFDTQNDFIVKYFVEYKCNKTHDCKLEYIYTKQPCQRRELYTLNLKDLYNKCEEEVTHKGFRADLMLSHSEHPERTPLFIEIAVTHDCEQEKINSGIPIVELKITEESDIQSSLEEENLLFINTQSNNPYSYGALPKIRFYNFKREYITNRQLHYFGVSKERDNTLCGHIELNELHCQNAEEVHYKEAIYEVAIPPAAFKGNFICNPYEFGTIKAIEKGLAIKYCPFCKYYMRCYGRITFEEHDKEKEGKQLSSRRIKLSSLTDEQIDKFKLAMNCKSYRKDYRLIYQKKQVYNDLPFLEWEK